MTMPAFQATQDQIPSTCPTDIVMAPMTRSKVAGRRAGEDAVADYYARRAAAACRPDRLRDGTTVGSGAGLRMTPTCQTSTSRKPWRLESASSRKSTA